jgi:hypothetical protein
MLDIGKYERGVVNITQDGVVDEDAMRVKVESVDDGTDTM